jgi:putative inorganic carbon (HCO3(-)) transporter
MNGEPHAREPQLTADLAPGVIVLLACAGWLVLLPAMELPVAIGYYDQKRFAQLALFLLVTVLLLVSGTLRTWAILQIRTLHGSTRLALTLLLALGIASCANARYPVYAFAELGILGCTAILALAVAAAARPLMPQVREAVALMLMAMMGLYLVRFVAGYLSSRIGVTPLYVPELYAGFGHLRYFSQWQTWTLPLAVVPFLTFRSLSLRLLALLLAVAWWALSFGTGTRGTTLALGIAVVCTAVLARRSLPWALAQIGCAAAGFALAWVAFVMPETIGEDLGLERLAGTLQSRETANLRIAFLAEALELGRTHPLLGIGPMHFAAHGEWAAHPHNSVAQLAVEWGIPATLIALAIVAVALRSWLGLLPAARDVTPLRPALTAAMLAAGVHALVSGLLVTPASQMMLALTAGLMLCEFNYLLAPHATTSTPDMRSARRTNGLAHVALIVASVAAVGAWLPAAIRDTALVGDSVQHAVTLGQRLAPRLWQHGFIDEPRDLRALTARATQLADDAVPGAGVPPAGRTNPRLPEHQ